MTTRQLATRWRLDLNWIRARLGELVRDGRALCSNGRWFARGTR